MTWKPFARTIREEHAAAQKANHYSHQFPGFERAYELALKWLLARRCDNLPVKYRIVDNVRYFLYVQAPDSLANTPEIAVIYTYDNNIVSIIDIMAG